MKWIQFPNDSDRVQGNSLLATKSVASRPRSQVFEVSEAGLKLRDDHHISYEGLPIPEPSGSDQIAVR
jgi:hypothetical protein